MKYKLLLSKLSWSVSFAATHVNMWCFHFFAKQTIACLQELLPCRSALVSCLAVLRGLSRCSLFTLRCGCVGLISGTHSQFTQQGMGKSSCLTQAWQCVATAECVAEEQRKAEAVEDGVGALGIGEAQQRSGTPC